MDRWLQSLPLLLAVGVTLPAPARARRYQPGPHRGLGEHPACARLADPADHPSAAGVVPAALPGTATTRRSSRCRANRAATARRASRAAPEPPRASPTPRRSASSRQHALVRPRGFDLRDPGAASRRWRSSAAGPGGSTGSATSRGSTRAPARASRCSTTPATTRARDIELPDQIWIARWDGRADTTTEAYLPPRRRLAAARPGQKQYQGGRRAVGRRDDQHRPRLPRRRAGGRWAWSGAGRRPHRLRHLPHDGAGTGEDACRSVGSGVCSASCTSRALPAVNGVRPTPPRSRPPRRSSTKRGSPSTTWTRAAGCRSSSPATGRS